MSIMLLKKVTFSGCCLAVIICWSVVHVILDKVTCKTKEKTDRRTRTVKDIPLMPHYWDSGKASLGNMRQIFTAVSKTITARRHLLKHLPVGRVTDLALQLSQVVYCLYLLGPRPTTTLIRIFNSMTNVQLKSWWWTCFPFINFSL